jgi:hypothetical protein
VARWPIAREMGHSALAHLGEGRMSPGCEAQRPTSSAATLARVASVTFSFGGAYGGCRTLANPIATGAGRLTVTAAGQSLTCVEIGAGCTALPHGNGTFGGRDAGTGITDITYTVDGPSAPSMFWTP